MAAEDDYRILVVDDSPDDRMLVIREIRKVLPRAHVDEAGGPDELDALLRHPVWDVAITDFQLRWSTGLDVFQRLRAAVPDLPVIMFTASGNEEVAVQAMKQGLDDYVTKTAKHYGRVPYAVLACAQRRRQKREIEAANAALRESESLYRVLSEATPDFVWVADAKGRTQYANGNWCAYTGYTVERINAEGWQALNHPEDRPLLARAWEAGMDHGAASEIEYRYRRHDGEYRWFLGRMVPLKDEQGQVLRWVGLATDIHQRKLMEQDLRATAAALEEADRQKNQFLATLAHELRNPMAPIRYAAALIRPEAKPEVLQKARTTIERQSALMSRLLDDLLDMSRITRDVIELKRAPIDMAQVVQEVADNVRPDAGAQRHTLVVEVGTQPLWVDGDLARLQQVVGNLLGNAIKYTPPGGRVEALLDTDGNQARLRVRDTGVGLAPEMLPQLFRLFSQLHRGLTVSSGGLGIGLAVSKRLVELHGGTLVAASQGLGAGAEFTARLPLTRPPQVASARTGEEGATRLPRSRVLVVDDNRDAAVILADVLAGHGHDVEVATSGREALATARATPPHVVVLDIGLPDLSGVEVARALRADPSTAGAAIIAVTGWGQDEDRRRTKAVGVDHHLVKPVSPDLLMETIALALSGQKKVL